MFFQMSVGSAENGYLSLEKCPFLQASNHVSPIEPWGHGKKDEWDLVENKISPWISFWIATWAF